MCWSFEVSLASWIIGTVVAIYFWIRNRKNDPILGALVFVYSNMQLAEALMWLDRNCGAVNKTGTIIAYISLWMHPLAVGYGIYQAYGRLEPLLIGFFILAIGLIRMPQMKCSTPTCESNGHLKWGFKPTFYLWVFIATIILLFLYVRPLTYAVIAFSFYAVAFALTAITIPSESVGSVWCLIAAIYAPLVAGMTYFVKQ